MLDFAWIFAGMGLISFIIRLCSIMVCIFDWGVSIHWYWRGSGGSSSGSSVTSSCFTTAISNECNYMISSLYKNSSIKYYKLVI